MLGQYCSSDDDAVIEQGIENVKRILADNFVRPDEAQKVISSFVSVEAIRSLMVTVNLNLRYDEYEATFSNLGLGGIPISEEYAENTTGSFVVVYGALYSWRMTQEKMQYQR